MTDTPTINFKRGDSFVLNIAITDPNSTASLAAQVVLTDAEETLAAAEVVLAAAIAAIPFVQQDVDDAQAIVDTAITDLAAAQAVYDATIIVSIVGWTITSKLMWCGKFISTLTVTIVSAVGGTFTIDAEEAITLLWKMRKHDMDISFLRTEGTTSSETIIINVERGATNG